MQIEKGIRKAKQPELVCTNAGERKIDEVAKSFGMKDDTRQEIHGKHYSLFKHGRLTQNNAQEYN